MHPTGTITHGELDLFGGRAPQRTISTRCTPMVCTASFQERYTGNSYSSPNIKLSLMKVIHKVEEFKNGVAHEESDGVKQ